MLCILLASLLLPHAPAQAAPVEMTTYQMVLLKKGTAPPPAAPEAQKRMQDEHLARLADLNRKRINLFYGPVVAPDSGRSRGESRGARARSVSVDDVQGDPAVAIRSNS